MLKMLTQIVTEGGIARPDGSRFTIPTEVISVEEDANRKLVRWLEKKKFKRITMVSDPNTAPLTPTLDAEIISLPQGVKPEKQLAESMAAKIGDVAIAVGSGTISDLVKYASMLAGKPYVMLATAPSMNGYLSVTASLLEDGHKESHKAQLPLALFADVDVLANAPERLRQAGLGDAICRSTAQADWLLSHLVLDTYYDETPFKLQTEAERAVFTNPADVKSLMEWLLLGGLGMSYCGGSYPASQGEHLIAHTMEMLHPELTHGQLHGEQIAVTTLTMARLQEIIIKGNAPILQAPPEEAAAIMAQKGISKNNLLKLNEKMLKDWPAIQQEIARVIVPSSRIESTLCRVKAPVSADSLGWGKDVFEETIAAAPLYRNRFTFLDLALLTNL